jgi:hypothetical protein
MDSAGVEEGVVVLVLDIVENLPENVFLSFKLPEWSRKSREWRASEAGERRVPDLNIDLRGDVRNDCCDDELDSAAR